MTSADRCGWVCGGIYLYPTTLPALDWYILQCGVFGPAGALTRKEDNNALSIVPVYRVVYMLLVAGNKWCV